MDSLFHYFSGVVGGLQQTSYSVGEGNGSLSVCVLINRTAERDVVVSLIAISLTAQGRAYYMNSMDVHLDSNTVLSFIPQYSTTMLSQHRWNSQSWQEQISSALAFPFLMTQYWRTLNYSQ